MAGVGEAQKHTEEVNTMGSRRGQSTLEYILMVATIVVAVLLGVNAFLRPQVSNAIETSSGVITNAATHLKNCTDGDDLTLC